MNRDELRSDGSNCRTLPCQPWLGRHSEIARPTGKDAYSSYSLSTESINIFHDAFNYTSRILKESLPMRSLILALSFFVGAVAAESITVYKSPTCGCCTEWVKIMESKGHDVKVEHPFNLQATKADLGVPKRLGSCHTAVIDGYLFEGHIPEQDIVRFLAKPPAGAKGLAVPGMPQISPGMAPPGKAYSGFKVIGFDDNGKLSLVNQY